MPVEAHIDPAVQAADEIRQLISDADALDSRPWSLRPASVARDYLPQSELASAVSSELRVTVMPGLEEDEQQISRSAVQVTFPIAIAIEQKPATYSADVLDELCGFSADIVRFLRFVNLPCGAKHTGLTKAVPRYSWRLLKTGRTFVAIRRLYFELHLQGVRH